ncbi:MAG: thioredoxin family protein, partial [Candidatus Omnitrophica bacterium]|nr:thioredoxin family protein [Candidatus Omnitrophota bacterium]
LVEQIHSRQKSPVVSSVFYTLGILASFWVLLLVLLLLKSAGQSIGWGFQFKSPHFLIFITTLLFVMGLNLLGIFEIGTGLTTFGSKFKKGEGWGESFFNGVLATIVATPCMAPFMGTAVGTALTQTTLIAFIIFTFLGLGLAFPYLIISIFPGLHRLVPKPGLWMEHLKKLLAFPLFLTVLWLAWVLGRQYGVGAMAMLLYGQALIALALWIWGTWNVPASKANIQMAARIWAGIFLVIGLFLTYQSIAGEKERNMPRQAGLWQPFSPGLLEQLLREERAVFVNFTADWCLTCQANKELVIHRPGVLEAFQQNGVALLEADWTNFDPDITEELARYGRSGVPLYVFYPSGQKEPVILPEIITAQILLDILEQQDKSITINSEEE